MAKGNGGDHNGSNKPQFFKVLMPGFEKELSIPRAFNKHIINMEGETATILSPLGNPWHLGIRRDDQTMCFREGWPEFARAHELNLGYFVVFHYEGNLTFSFTVFNTTACNKEYNPAEAVEIVDHSSTERRDQNSDHLSKNVGRRPLTRSYARKMNEETSRKRVEAGTSQSPVKFNAEEGKRWISETKFEVTLKCYNLSKPYLYVPAPFRAMSDLLAKREITLKDPKGCSWSVNVHNKHNARGLSQTYFKSGWLEFCAANGLEEGDRLIFEHLITKKDTILVHILKE